jgi:RNA polymerase sigma-70 factor (ECF subfamily)
MDVSRPDGSRNDRHERFLELTMPHIDAIWNIATRTMRDRGRAEDLVQDTYLRAFAAFDGYRGGDSRSWLVSICLNAARSQARAARARPTEDLSNDLVDYAAVAPDASGAALQSLDREALQLALDQLPEPQRICIILVDLGGLTAQHAADTLGCPRGTVLARVHRGRRRLAALLAEAGVRP